MIFLAARGEVYGSLTVVFLFGGADVIVGAKLVMLLIWVGAATSKLNKHFPFVVASMLSNNPFIASKWVKRQLVHAVSRRPTARPLGEGRLLTRAR